MEGNGGEAAIFIGHEKGRVSRTNLLPRERAWGMRAVQDGSRRDGYVSCWGAGMRIDLSASRGSSREYHPALDGAPGWGRRVIKGESNSIGGNSWTLCLGRSLLGN